LIKLPKDKAQEKKLTKDALKNNDYQDWFIKQTKNHTKLDKKA